MNALHVLTILFVPIGPKLPDIFYRVGMISVINVTLLTGQEVYNHDDISEEDYF
ncbi:MAG: hypothetical protein OEM77_08085 [Nitrosopumilus sp.]|nr:hypothetical protein [Nitrosopumilus sp.]MDH3779618.1 hypothetical protein [Nitrosopumilus sp.]MDH3854722.1 hypothetical protein [Nitrosopumilus sp.]